MRQTVLDSLVDVIATSVMLAVGILICNGVFGMTYFESAVLTLLVSIERECTLSRRAVEEE